MYLPNTHILIHIRQNDRQRLGKAVEVLNKVLEVLPSPTSAINPQTGATAGVGEQVRHH
jgi:hypothetical protein